MENLCWDILDLEADIVYYLDRKDFKAEKPAIHIFGVGSLGHMPKKRGDKFTLWFGRGIERWSFKTLKEALKNVQKILDTATIPIKPRIVKKR